MTALFVVVTFLLLYPYFVYPVILPVLSRLFGRPPGRKEGTPTVSLLIPAYNEDRVLRRKLENSLALDYPKDRLEVLVGSDGSSDDTVRIAEEFRGDRVRVLAFAERRGKPSVLADLFAASRGEILILTDASALIHPAAVREIVATLGAPEVGVVSGEMVPEHGEGTVSTLDLYRRLDDHLRRNESRWHSSMGAAGALYGIRRDLYAPPPAGTILDDFVVPLRTVERGYRVLICPQARFRDLEPFTLEAEFRRKVRTLAGNFQAMGWLWRLLVPFRSPVWFQLLSHKVLRLLTPYFMLALLPMNALLVDRPLFRAIFLLQAAFYVLALLGLLLRRERRRIPFFAYPFLFVVLQAANLLSLFLLLSGQVTMKWRRPSQRA